MPLSPGTRLGVYEIVAPLGAGGMGEVYRARDARLGRDVAVKVLPSSFAADPDALARFEREMKTLAGLPHPHIVAIYDAGHEAVHTGTLAYAVTELLEGETLADVVARGPLPVRKALEYGVQIARALAAAHDRGIVHRDLKPANVIVTRDGHVKVLDFGLARPAPAAGDAATAANTAPGLVMGTVGYMAPEQARGLVVDHRADIFAFGCLMYELIAGRRAFERATAADTLSAILHEDPPPFSSQGPAVPAALERVVLRCLEKEPGERFQSARDLAFALDALSSVASGPASGRVPARPTRAWKGRLAAAAALAAVAGAFAVGRSLAPSGSTLPPTITQLTFERGVIRSARFAPDAETIVYGARWGGDQSRLFVARADTAESKALDLPSGDVLAIAGTGDMLLSLERHYLTSSWTADGTLARARLFGSSAREVLERVRDADFLPGDAVALARRVDGQDQLEVPQGNVVFQTPGYIGCVRVSRDGRRVAFLEHPLFGDNRGYVALYDGRQVRRLTPEYSGIEALSWSADGKEIWYGGANDEATWPIKAIDPDVTTPRHGRVVWYVPTNLMLLDIDARGRVLLTANDAAELAAGADGRTPERTLSSNGWVVPADISADGRTALLFASDSDPDYSVVIRRMDGSAPVKIGSGRAQELSPDGKWALSITPSTPYRVFLLPTGAGEARPLDIGDLTPNVGVFLPGRTLRVAIVGSRNGAPAAAIIDATTGERRTIDLPELRGRAFSLRRFLRTSASPDGALLAVQADDWSVLAWPTSGSGPARTLASLASSEAFLGWSTDPSRIFVATWSGPRARIESLDITSGRRTPVREITISDPAGALTTPELFVSPDGRAYVYGLPRMLSTLYLVTGLR